jgi:GNAT superfamily N-acetyltransferase
VGVTGPREPGGGELGDLIVRSRRAEDADALVAALAQVHERDAYPVRSSRVTQEWVYEGTDVAWVAQLDGRVVGHVALVRVDDAWELTRYFVAVDARGTGAGRALLDVAEAWADVDGVPMRLVVMQHNRDAQAAYERRGWQRDGSTTADFFLDGSGVAPVMLRYSRPAS